MNKSLKENDSGPFVRAHRRSLVVFLKILNFLEIKQSFIRDGRKVGSYMLMLNMLEEQVSIMETWKNS